MMKLKCWMTFITLIAGLSGAVFAEVDTLERRGSLGIALQPAAQGIVLSAPPEAAAYQAADITAGAILAEIDGQPVSGWLDLQALTHQLPSGQRVDLTFDVDGERRSVTIEPQPSNPSVVPGADVIYGQVESADGLRIRTVTLVPEISALRSDQGLPGVFYIQGITCQSIDRITGRSHSRSRIFLDLLEAGFVVSFADKPGVGDSDGEACTEGGFDREIRAYQAAAAAFADREDIDASRVYAIGISMGGYQFPLIAEAVDFAGVITWGAGVEPWADYLIGNFRERAIMRPVVSPEQHEAGLRAMRRIVHALIIEGQQPDELRETMPQATALAEQQLGPLEAFAGRALDFHREADQAELWPAWTRYEGELLVLHGEYDWISTASDHAKAAEILNRMRPGSASVELLEGLDHGFTHHDSLEDSFTRLFNGDASDLFHQRAVDWLSELADTMVTAVE